MKIYTKEMIKERNAKKAKVQKTIKYIFMPIFMLFVIICVYIAYEKFILKRQDVDFLGYRTYVVLTGSMQPSINPNDLIIIRSAKQDEIKKDDIITFSTSNRTSTVTHRVVNIIERDGKTYYQTKGDNNNAEDIDLISYENIKGKYIAKISGIGGIITQTLTGSGLVIVLLIVMMCYNYSSNKEDRVLTREEARKKYNVCKYKTYKEDNEDAIQN